MRPRSAGVEELIGVLEEEHDSVRDWLQEMLSYVETGNIVDFRRRLEIIDETMIQHMLDEEATLLRAIIEAFGREGAHESIEVFQEHVRIDALIKEMKREFADDMVPEREKLDRLSSMMKEHFLKEERGVFRCAMDAARKLETS